MTIFFQKKTINGSELLPSIQKVETVKAIALSKIITEISLKALRAFVEKRFSVFDAAVGDNSCKIRAFKIASLGQEEAVFLEAKDLIDRLEVVNSNMNNIQASEKKLSLREFREKNEIEFELSEDLAFLIQSHFLFSVKEGYDRTNPALLQRIAPIANKTAKDWIHTTKQQLAKASVEVVRDEAKALADEKLQKMVSEFFVRRYENRSVLSNTYSMETLFRSALKKGMLVVFKSKEESALFESNLTRSRFEKRDLVWRDFERPAIVIEGSGYICEKIDFVDQIIIRAAKDPQYLEGEKSEEIDFDSLKEDFDVQMEKHRCGALKQIPISFHINHILCDQAKNVIRPAWHSCNWFGDDLNIEPGSFEKLKI